jgi:hypothetical protein
MDKYQYFVAISFNSIIVEGQADGNYRAEIYIDFIRPNHAGTVAKNATI